MKQSCLERRPACKDQVKCVAPLQRRELSDHEVWTDQPALAKYVAGGRVNISVRDID